MFALVGAGHPVFLVVIVSAIAGTWAYGALRDAAALSRPTFVPRHGGDLLPELRHALSADPAVAAPRRTAAATGSIAATATNAGRFPDGYNQRRGDAAIPPEEVEGAGFGP